MHYRNPITTLGLSADIQPSSFELHRIQKRLLAEFAIHEATRVDFNGESFDRQEVLALLESLKQPKIWAYHIRIAKQPPLLAFLTTGELTLFRTPKLLETLRAEAEEEHFKGFWQFIAPYFATQFDEKLSKAIRYQSTITLQTLLKSPLPLSEQFVSTAYRKAYRFLQQETKDLEALKAEPYRFIKEWSLEKRYLGKERIKTWNLLPDYFASLRSEYALKFEDIGHELYEKMQRRNLGRRLIRKALQLNMYEGARVRLEYLSKQMGVSFQQSSNKNFSWIMYLPAIIAALMFIFFVLYSLINLPEVNRNRSSIRTFQNQPAAARQPTNPYSTIRPISKEREHEYEVATKEEVIFMFDEGSRPNPAQERPSILDDLTDYHNNNLPEELSDALYTDFKRPENLPVSEGTAIYQLLNQSEFNIVLFIADKNEASNASIHFIPKESTTRIASPFRPGEARMFYYSGKHWISEQQYGTVVDDWIGIFPYLHACDPNGQILRYSTLRFYP